MTIARKGLDYSKAGMDWRAHNCFLSMERWIGAAHADTQALPPDTQTAFTDIVVKSFSNWSDLLKNAHSLGKALDKVEQALAIDALNDMLQRQRYDLLVRLKRPGQAMKSLKEYRCILEAEGFDEFEVDDVIENILSS
jgi:Spy/CpxP family protein refolding chaperone